MRHDKLGLQLELLLLLTENRQWTVEMLCDKLDISRRNLYYYLEFFKRADFDIKRYGSYYSISRQSPFISKLCDVVKFTDAEAVLLRRLLNTADEKDLLVRSAKKKLERFYDFHVLEETGQNKLHAKFAQKIYEAIMSERMVIIHDYSSPHSGSVSDREIEPFLLMNGNHDVRAYEPSSKTNKTFRISRMGNVELTDREWRFRSKHMAMFTDYFNFSGDHPQEICLRLDQLSYNVLVEEYPKCERDIVPEEDGKHWIFKPSVCSMLGVGRFILGLYDHVEIIDSPELEAYVNEKLNAYMQKMTASATPETK